MTNEEKSSLINLLESYKPDGHYYDGYHNFSRRVDEAVCNRLDNGWEVKRAMYYIQDLKDTEHFPVVGYIDINRAMADVILQAISMGAEPPKRAA